MGLTLGNYGFEDECPKDAWEKALFIDRLMRFKLTNIYDLQYRKTYQDFLTRPFVFILTLLRYQPLHLYQLYQALGQRQSDPRLNPEIGSDILAEFSKYKPYNATVIESFCEDYKMELLVREEARRTAKPMLDWCEQLGLIFQHDDWYYITSLGLSVQAKYSTYIPIWFHQLGEDAEVKASLILMYLAAKKAGFQIKPDRLAKISYPSLITVKERVDETLEDLQRDFVIFNEDLNEISQVDFSFNYDIPIEKRDLVYDLGMQNMKHIGLKDIDFKDFDIVEIKPLEKEIVETAQEKTISKIGEILGVTVPRPELFTVPFEWTTCFLLRSIGFKAEKYQGQFAETCELPMAEDNPDILVVNDLTTLVEAKSDAEWGARVRLDKRVQGEILSYQEYVESVNVNSALFICEGHFDEGEFVKPISPLLKHKLNRIVLATQRHLAKILRDKDLQLALKNKLTRPSDFDPTERILS